jgi:hypothetical protein
MSIIIEDIKIDPNDRVILNGKSSFTPKTAKILLKKSPNSQTLSALFKHTQIQDLTILLHPDVCKKYMDENPFFTDWLETVPDKLCIHHNRVHNILLCPDHICDHCKTLGHHEIICPMD